MANENQRPVAEGDMMIVAQRKAGEGINVSIEAPTPTDALTGICFLIEEYARLTGIPVQGVVARLAVVLLTEKPQAEESQ